MTPRSRKILTQIASLALGFGLLYLALRNVDLRSIGRALIEADYRWAFPLLVFVIASHVLRAWRWKMLLEALPKSDAAEPKRFSLVTAFNSVMIGYMVNYAFPRLGEVARSANMARQENEKFSGVLGTVVAERIFDVITLFMAIGSVCILFWDQLVSLYRVADVEGNAGPSLSPFDVLGLIALVGLLLGVGYAVWRIISHRYHSKSTILRQRISTALKSFRSGVATLVSSGRPIGLTLTTIGMWACYLVMAYLPFVMLGMNVPYGISLLDAWGIMVIGTLGVVVPAPGGIGSYHYITVLALVNLFNVDQEPAATYAVLTHAAQLILYTFIGFSALLAQSSSLKILRETAGTGNPDSG